MEDDKTTKDLINRIKKLEVQIEQVQLELNQMSDIKDKLNAIIARLKNYQEHATGITKYLYHDVIKQLDTIEQHNWYEE